MKKKLYTAKEVAAFLKVSKDTVWRYGRNGVLPSKRYGRTVRFELPEEDVNERRQDGTKATQQGL